MTSYIQNWLNTDIKLSLTITSPTRQFANGFLFGELLMALGWIDGGVYGEFTDGATTLIRLRNFTLVSTCLLQNGVVFDKKVIPLIMTEARGAVSDLILRIKERKKAIDKPPKVSESHTTTLKQLRASGSEQPAKSNRPRTTGSGRSCSHRLCSHRLCSHLFPICSHRALCDTPGPTPRLHHHSAPQNLHPPPPDRLGNGRLHAENNV